MKKLVALVAFVAIALFVWSCTKKTEETNKSILSKKELVGKRFFLEEAKVTPTKPEEEVVYSIRFEENNAEYITGDAIYLQTYELKEGKIICTDRLSNTVSTYTIVDATTLKRNDNTVWILEK